MEQDINHIIFGKDETTNIVSIEQKDGYVELYKEYPDRIEVEKRSSKHWILASRRITDQFVKLKGNQHYQYGIQFDNQDDWKKYKSWWSKKSDIYSVSNTKEMCMLNTGITYFKGITPVDVSLMALDSETTGLDGDAEDAKLLLISTTYRKNGKVTKKLFSYDEYENEGKMLEAFCDYVREMNPSLILGHNLVSFDFPYFQKRADKFGVTLSLGRDDSKLQFSYYPSKFRVDGNRDLNYTKCSIYGREIIDTYFLAMKYDTSRKYNSYGLKPIIDYEGLTATGRIFYDAAQIRNNYLIPEEWSKIKEYCIFDSDDVIILFDLMIPSFFYFCRSVPKSFQAMMETASGSQLNSMLVRSYLQIKHSIAKGSEKEQFEGAISNGFPGIYRHALKWDVSSLYPSIMLEYQVFDKHKDPYKFMIKSLDYFRTERLRNKQLAKSGSQYHQDLSDSQKIFANSVYGLLGTPGLNYNFMAGAALVTKYGREILNKAVVWATGKSYEQHVTERLSPT